MVYFSDNTIKPNNRLIEWLFWPWCCDSSLAKYTFQSTLTTIVVAIFNFFLLYSLFDNAHTGRLGWTHCAAATLGGAGQLCNLPLLLQSNQSLWYNTQHCIQCIAARGNTLQCGAKSTLSICSITLKTLQQGTNAHQWGPKHFPYAATEWNVKVIWGNTCKYLEPQSNFFTAVTFCRDFFNAGAQFGGNSVSVWREEWSCIQPWPSRWGTGPTTRLCSWQLSTTENTFGRYLLHFQNSVL